MNQRITVLRPEIAEKYGAPEYLEIYGNLEKYTRFYSKLPPKIQIDPKADK